MVRLKLFAFSLFIFLGGCATVDRGVVVPVSLIDSVQVPGYEEIRYSSNDAEQLLVEEFQMAIKLADQKKQEINVLAISGGGADGAFGAGLLSGWTKNGGRPEFQVVTGVSTGALIAPFAFLGSEYDEPLRIAYTTLHADNIFHLRNIFRIIRGDSIASTGPLFKTISRFIDEELLATIAREHAKGRRLFVMSTDLDAQRPVIWNMGAIAQSGNPGALELFRQIIVASASLPVIFPPQYIEVESKGIRYTEMHVDGGVMGQVFLHLPKLNDVNKKGNVKINAYVIRNSKVIGGYSAMTPLIIPIMARTIKTLILTQGIGDLYEIYDEAKAGGAEFHLAYVPDDYVINNDEMFTPKGMKKMFDAAFAASSKGYPWLEQPPKVF